jgi:hypothetical protein
MDRTTLRQALRFGGSSRFNDRSGLGRYGMGLLNSSLSQARRVEVYSWVRPAKVLFTYLDVDEIAAGETTEVPIPEPAHLPDWLNEPRGETGTLVVWTCCDRLDHRRPTTIARKLFSPLGRVFRYFLWDGVEILVNGEPVKPIDPLYLHPEAVHRGASCYAEPMVCSVEARTANGASRGTGTVTVTFAELPVAAWHRLSNEEKRNRGVTNGAGVSVVRANREIDFGWFFLGGKRRENYDDWWRCEVRFDPILDEAFGITHTKQQIRPQEYLLEALSHDIESVARALYGRVRDAHLRLKAEDRTAPIERVATERDALLEPLPRPRPRPEEQPLLDTLEKKHPLLKGAPAPAESGGLSYRIVQEPLADASFFTFAVREGLLVLVLNPEHPFFRKVYKPLLDSDADADRVRREQLDLVLLSAARAEAAATREAQREALQAYRKLWSDNLATFLNG